MNLETSLLAYIEVTNDSYNLCYSNGKTKNLTCTNERLEKILSDLRNANYIEVKNGESIYFVDCLFNKIYGWPTTLISENAKKNLSKAFSEDIEEWSKNLAHLVCGLYYIGEENALVTTLQKDIKIGIEACMEKYNINTQ
jgi:hypothetical protein